MLEIRPESSPGYGYGGIHGFTGLTEFRYIDDSGDKVEVWGYWPSGKVKFKYRIVGGLLQGEHRCWNENGELMLEENYLDDQLNGIRREWYDGKVLKSEEHYRCGLGNGWYRYWYPNGRRHAQYLVINNRYNGPYFLWSLTTKVKDVYHYVDGFRHGECKIYDLEGYLARKAFFFKGVLIPRRLKKLIDSGSLTAGDILKIRNTAVRRVCLEELGYSKFLSQLEHEVIDRNGDYELIRIDWHKREEPIHLVKVRCPSTGAFYTLRVPPVMKTVKAAIAWTFGVKEEKYCPETET
jgi:hypothetical protein